MKEELQGLQEGSEVNIYLGFLKGTLKKIPY